MPDLIVETPRTKLVPADVSDGTALYDLLLDLGLHSMPSREAFLASFDAGDYFSVHACRTGQVVGYANLHSPDPAGHVQMGIFTDPAKAGYGIGGEAMILLVNYAFAKWSELRKIYFSTTEASLERLGVGNLPYEAALPDHLYFRGRLWTVYIYALHRRVWEEQSGPLLDRMLGRPAAEPEDEYRPTAWQYVVESVKWLSGNRK
ncbi:GNAT family N-acetyltransferase [Nonomuraea sp. NN258]|uniref:GNAT family N-acetyltransferase n=1 Tax=Nonomuraea antri TaxID=2730852 RepID=UPI001569BCFE|nr:GNAT family protein [Nonomuraea antri]NRQ31690.1 GNAT family N-acetyltransferase [Nonomuraea antri]